MSKESKEINTCINCVHANVEGVESVLYVMKYIKCYACRKRRKNKNTYYVDFWTRSAWLMVEHVVWISSHKTRDTCGKNDSRLRFVLRTFPASTISLSLHLCFFHVDSMDWLKLNYLHRSTAFTPQSNLPRISIFSLRVLSVCWCLAFERDILKCNAERKTQSFISFRMHLLLMSKESKE